MEKIPMSAPDLDDSDIIAVLDVLKSGRIAFGQKTREFEELMAEYIGVKYAVAVSSGTAGLHILVRAMGIQAGDHVLVPSFTFCSSVNVIVYERAKPIFVDIENETYNIDLNDLERKITPKSKAIIVVDVFGHPAEFDEIMKIAEKYNLKVIDDSCEALGSEYKGRKVGQFGDAAVFAFYPNKQMTTGEGGIIVTNDEDIARIARSLRNQGRTETSAWLEYEMLGYNYRMDELSAALGISQLKKLDLFLQKRERVAKGYTERLKKISVVKTPIVKPYVKMSWFVYVITLAKGIRRDLVMRELARMGIPSRGYFSPIHTQTYIRNYFDEDIPSLSITEDIGSRTLALPFHNNLTDSEIEYVVNSLEEAIDRICYQ